MKRGVARREFLSGAVAASMALSGATTIEAPSGSESTVAKNSQARLLVGCCALSYLRYFNGGSMTMEDFIVKCTELGVQGVDVTTYWLKSTEPEYLASLRHLAFRNGIPLSGVAIRTEMCQAGGALRAEEVRKIQQWVDVTEALGSSHLRVFGGTVPNGATEKQCIGWVAECMKPACEYAGKKGITLGIENHGGITARASMILEIVEKVDSPFAGVNLDISNFEAKTEEEMYSDVEACVPKATHVHVRDIFTTSKGPIDLERVWRLFAKGNYKGYMSAEYEAEEDPMTGVPKLLDKIKALCRKYSTV
jgi:sugar phosphate isomerase/epimerase